MPNPTASPDTNGQPPAHLTLKRVAIDTYRENVAYLHRDCAVYRAEGFQALSKIAISNHGHRILAVLNVVDDASLVSPGQLGLSEQAFAQFGCAECAQVHVAHAEPPQSMDAVRRKMGGERLSPEDFRAITRDIVDNRYSKTEMAAFLVASGQTGLDRDEILYLTQAMLDSGERLDWDEPLVATSTASAASPATAPPCWWCRSSPRTAC
jgi:thymidine phosphorylase